MLETNHSSSCVMRMVTAMFLTKNLLIDWRLGERHFMRSLIDGALAAQFMENVREIIENWTESVL